MDNRNGKRMMAAACRYASCRFALNYCMYGDMLSDRNEDSDSLGYVISADGVNAWFSGDTLFSRKIVEDIGDVHVDIAFISINGVGNNMNAVDAASLIKLIEPDIAVPVHWDMFEHYGVDPTGFTSLFSTKDRTRTKVLKAYESIEF